MTSRPLRIECLLTAAIVAIPSIVVSQEATQYVESEVRNGGVVRGTVSFTGEATPPEQLAVTTDIDVCGKEPLSDETLLVGESGGLRNAVVWLSDIEAGKAWEARDEPPAIGQAACRFIPHVLVVPAGETFEILNDDGILHNFNSQSSKNRPLNKAQPGMLKKLTAEFERPEIVGVHCDVHGWMSAWIVVAAHPYYAVTDEDGGFKLQDVPPGSYTLQVWHEKLGTLSRQVTASSRGEVQVDVQYTPE